MKKFICVLLCVLMCAATVALVACDKKEETLKFGMGVHISASATDATADKDGTGKVDVTIAAVTVDKDGKIEDIEKLSKAVSDEWGEYKGTKVTEGTTVATPPTGSSTPAPKPSRAAELAAKYHANLYGGSDKPAETHADNTTNNTAKGE